MVSKFRHFGKDKNPPVYANCASVSTDSIKKVMKDNEKKKKNSLRAQPVKHNVTRCTSTNNIKS